MVVARQTHCLADALEADRRLEYGPAAQLSLIGSLQGLPGGLAGRVAIAS